MTTIRATCDDCGDVAFTADDIQVHHQHPGDVFHYTFRCPSCGVRTAKPTSAEMARKLHRSGVEMRHWSEPAETAEHPGDDIPALTLAEVEVFCEGLEDADWFDELFEEPGPH